MDGVPASIHAGPRAAGCSTRVAGAEQAAAIATPASVVRRPERVRIIVLPLRGREALARFIKYASLGRSVGNVCSLAYAGEQCESYEEASVASAMALARSARTATRHENFSWPDRK